MPEPTPAARSAVQKLDEFFNSLSPDEQAVIGDIIRRAASDASKGEGPKEDPQEGGFLLAMTQDNATALFSYFENWGQAGIFLAH